MSWKRTSLVTFASLTASLSSFAATARAANLGQADFANSCNAAVQADFEDGVLFLHSFEFDQAEDEFRKVESKDPHCVIAAWGMALAETDRDGANAPRKTLEAGWSELQPWISQRAGTEREQMYFDAVKEMYEGFQDASGSIRWNRYLAKMESIRKQYPNDLSASLFYALGLVWTAGSGQEGLIQRRKALAILLPIFRAHPDNPGAAHYIIHAADTPELASVALPAAHRYAAIAPDSPHALHMPSHIFNRLGDWPDSIQSNLASARVARAWIRSGRGGMFDEQHALNNLEYAYLQLGKLKEAHEVIGEIDQVNQSTDGDPWGPVDARLYFDIETHDWQDALTLEPPAQSPFDENFDIYWIHAIADARLGKADAARDSLEEFRKSSTDWIGSHQQSATLRETLHLALMEAEAWTLYSEGRKQDATKELSDAVGFEKNHPIYYADVLPRPSSEMLGEMLGQMGKHEESCAAFQTALAMAPNTFNTLQGLRACSNRAALR